MPSFQVLITIMDIFSKNKICVKLSILTTLFVWDFSTTGGIAEMYLMNSKTESIYFRKRFNTVKAAIQEGANIIPIFCFGNTKLFTSLNESMIDKDGKESFLSRISRKFRASIVFFYGRHYLPVPYRHPIKLVTGEIVEVTQISEPTPEQVQDVMEKVIKSIQKLYDEKKPDWETRPLVIV